MEPSHGQNSIGPGAIRSRSSVLWLSAFICVYTRLMSLSEIEQRIEAAKEAVMAETGLMHGEFGRARSEIKHDGTKVTAVDIAISQHLQDAVALRFPEDQFFSEELTPTDLPTPVTSRFCWVCDPIDGTNNYANGISH